MITYRSPLGNLTTASFALTLSVVGRYNYLMRPFKVLLWILFTLTIVIFALHLTGNYQATDRLTSLFWSVQLRLPLTLSFEQFLVILSTVSLVAAVLFIVGSMMVLGIMAGRYAIAHQRAAGQVAASNREILHVKEQCQRQYDHLLRLGQTLTKQLDKRVIVQAILQAASRVTSGTQANSIVAFWLFHSETETYGFEMGLYCDEALFTKTEFAAAEAPFAQMVSSQKPSALSTWKTPAPFVADDKAARLGAATSLIAVPLVVEERVAGLLTIFCHPDVLKSYEADRSFYDAVWTELMLAAIIAIQGAITIFDRLTNVHTREYLVTRLIQEIERANRFQLPLSLLMIDIDNFKLVNDTLGHQKGDAVLKIIAKLVKKEVRAIDLVGRYGGEEFIVMLPETGYGADTASASGALAVAERIRKGVDDEFRGLQKPLDLTISLGVAVRRFPEDREMAYEELVRLADEQLYRAKTTGKNKVCAALPEKPQATL